MYTRTPHRKNSYISPLIFVWIIVNTISLQGRMRFIRGCEIEGYLDEEGRVVQEGFEKPKYKTRMRTVRVYLDVNQYQVIIAVAGN